MSTRNHQNERPYLAKLPLALSVALLIVAYAGAAHADAAAPAAADPAAGAWLDTLKLSGHFDGGITVNPAVPADSQNFGSLYTDKANQFMLNQLMLTAERPIDSQSSKFDIGFKLQGMYGSDARYTHALAVMDHMIHSRNQLDITEATVNMHLPVLFEGGMDVKVGHYPSPMGIETIDATGNTFYSHSYIYNFGVATDATGILTVSHISPMLDLYAGVDTGINAGFTSNGINNEPVKGQFGANLNLMGGNLTILALTHIGAEDTPVSGVSGGSLRYVNDIATTWKVNDNLTLMNDANYIADDGLKAVGYGMAQYAVYSLNEHVSLAARAEVWRDDAGAFVASFPGYFDFTNASRGLPNTAVAGGHTTYGALTVGVNIKPDVPKAVEGLVIRPELRGDESFSAAKPFNKGNDRLSFTPAVDVVVPF